VADAMASLPEIIAGIIRLILQPVLVGVVALGMALVRELAPRWPPSLRRAIFDLILVGLSGLLLVLVALQVVSSR